MVIYGITLVLLVYAVVDLTRTPGAQVRALPKALWYVVLLLLPLVGSLAWLLVGRPRRERPGTAPAAPARPIAPDDDEDFLRELRRRSRDPRDDAA